MPKNPPRREVPPESPDWQEMLWACVFVGLVLAGLGGMGWATYEVFFRD